MANMSYCRFENTFADLQDCDTHWDDKPDDKLSSNGERRGKQKLRELILEMAQRFQEEDDETDAD